MENIITKMKTLITKTEDEYFNEDGGSTKFEIITLFGLPVYKNISEKHLYSNKEFQKTLLEGLQYLEKCQREMCL
jgi:hypothetical protein